VLDQVFVAHYTPMVERRVGLTARLDQVGLLNRTRWVEAYDREDLTPADIETRYSQFRYLKDFPDGVYLTTKLQTKHMSLAFKHAEALRMIVDGQFATSLILEDDAVFSGNDFEQILQKYLQQMPADWDVLCLNEGNSALNHIAGGDLVADQLVYPKVWSGKGSQHQVWSENVFRGTAGYVVSLAAATKLVGNMLPLALPIDNELCLWCNKLSLEVFWGEPTLISQGSTTGEAGMASTLTDNTQNRGTTAAEIETYSHALHLVTQHRPSSTSSTTTVQVDDDTGEEHVLSHYPPGVLAQLRLFLGSAVVECACGADDGDSEASDVPECCAAMGALTDWADGEQRHIVQARAEIQQANSIHTAAGERETNPHAKQGWADAALSSHTMLLALDRLLSSSAGGVEEAVNPVDAAVAAQAGAQAVDAARDGRMVMLGALLPLLAAGAAHTDAQGSSLLMIAAQQGHVGSIRVLLTSGADTGATDQSGAAALAYAANGGSAAAVRELCAAAPAGAADALDGSGTTALIRAAIAGHTAVLEALAQPPCTASLDQTDPSGSTALMCVALVGEHSAPSRY
jgi:GR25 family glycosyltransferase involved in LPS biosynthesis